MRLFNSLSRSIEPFQPINPPKVGMYTCGQTVYDYAHIGHGKKYIGDDLLRRTLEYLGYRVTHIQNVTDVGHLISDSDEGEDKIEKGMRKYGKSATEITHFFADYHFNAMDKFNILRPHTVAWASEHIADQIAMVEKLIKKGFAYETPEAVYFSVNKFEKYENIFGRGCLQSQITAAREAVQTGEYKKNPLDFALWFKAVGRFENHIMQWESPWGKGFPGWHIECSAMSIKYLGETFDIHTGGEDHLFPHHPNEIAQSESATGKPFAKYWVHHLFLKVEGKKMGKSLGNMYRVEDLIERGFEPLAFRYLCLQTHYRKPMNFTWQALEGAQSALNKLRGFAQEGSVGSAERALPTKSNATLQPINDFHNRFIQSISDDLNIPAALGVLWEAISASNEGALSKDTAVALIFDFDKVLGLNLQNTVSKVPENIELLAQERLKAREAKDYAKADSLRGQIEKEGYTVKDTSDGYVLS